MSRAADDMGEDTIVGVITRDGSGRRTFNILIGLAIAVSVLAVAFVALRPYILPYSLAERAHFIEPNLPADATVVKVVEKNRDEGDVWFTLREAPGLEGQRLLSIWSFTGRTYSFSRPATVKVVPATPAKAATAGKKVKVAAAPAVAKAKAPPVPAILRDGDTYLTYDKSTKRYHLHVDDPY